MRSPQGWEWLVILLVVLLLFGARRLPDLARGVGRSLRIFRSEVKEGQAEAGPTEPPPPANPAEPASGPSDDGGPHG